MSLWYFLHGFFHPWDGHSRSVSMLGARVAKGIFVPAWSILMVYLLAIWWSSPVAFSPSLGDAAAGGVHVALSVVAALAAWRRVWWVLGLALVLVSLNMFGMTEELVRLLHG